MDADTEAFYAGLVARYPRYRGEVEKLKETLERLEQAITALPWCAETRQPLAEESARMAATLKRVADGQWLLGWSANKPKERVGQKRALRELEDLESLSRRLWEHLDSGVHLESGRAIEEALKRDGASIEVLLRLQSKLSTLLCVIPEAHKALQDARARKPRAGKPGRRRALYLAAASASVYYCATGMEPTVHSKSPRGETKGQKQRDGSPFLDFLTRVFAALQMEFTPGSVARSLLYREKGCTLEGIQEFEDLRAATAPYGNIYLPLLPI